MQAPAPGEHPDADLLTAFAEHSLSGTERESVLMHLAACISCREVVSLVAPETREPEVAAPVAAPWFRWPVLRWTAVAATVIVVGAAVSVLVPRERNAEVSVPATQTVPEKQAGLAESKRDDSIAATQPEHQQAKKSVARDEGGQRGPVDTPALKQKVQQAYVTDKSADDRFAAAAPAPSPKPAEAASEERETKSLADLDASKEGARKDADRNDLAKGALVGGQTGASAKLEQQSNAQNQQQANDRQYQANAQSELRANVPNAPPPPMVQNEAVIIRPAGQPAFNDAVKSKNMEAGRSRNVVPLAPMRWRVSASGAVERSPDGNTWEKVEIDQGVTFRAMSSNGGDLWAGGSAGALFHSSDAGRTWARVKVGDEGMWVTDAITGVDFPSARSGFVTTASGAIWVTQDSGHTWQRRQ